MVTDPIADMLIRIKNASMAGRATISVSHSKMKEAVANILVKEGYIAEVSVSQEGLKKSLHIKLKYEDKKSVITQIVRKSKPGRRQYIPKTSIPRVLGGMGIAIVSTSSGIMTGKDAQKKGIGGELLCEIW
jgi:small subunit ribosomal protein S8